MQELHHMEPFLLDAKESVTGGSICSNDSKREYTSMTICTQGPVHRKRVFVLVNVRIGPHPHIYERVLTSTPPTPPTHRPPKARV